MNWLKSLNPYNGVPLWIILLWIGCCLMFILVRVWKFSGKTEKTIWYLGMLLYTFTILCATVFGRSRAKEPQINLDLFWCLRAAINTGDWKYWYFVIGNILMFLPLGYGLCKIISFYVQNKKNRWGEKHITIYSILICMLFSLTIEMMQYYTHTGLCELDDIFNNTFGGAMGSWIYSFINRKKS